MHQGLTTDERQRVKELEREVRETGERNSAESLGVFCPGGARPPREVMVRFINDHRDQYGIEPICAVVPIAPSTYFRHRARLMDPTAPSTRTRRDDELRIAIRQIWNANFQVYGPRKVWRELRRHGRVVARCAVVRLMHEMGLAGAVRGRAWITTTQRAGGRDPSTDRVDRHFVATRPNQL